MKNKIVKYYSRTNSNLLQCQLISFKAIILFSKLIIIVKCIFYVTLVG